MWFNVVEQFFHISVMYNEVMSFFKDMENKILADVTAGRGGHFAGLIQSVGPKGLVLGFDRDERAHEEDAALGVHLKNPQNTKLYKQAFSSMPLVLAQENLKLDGLICDLGVSSQQLNDPMRGFSLKNDGPIDMRMDQSSGISAYEWLKQTDEKTIADTLYKYAQEKKSRQIASLIKKSWPIKDSTLALANLITKAIHPKKYSKIHPATRSFQAIRIAVNNEMSELESLLKNLPEILNPKAIAVFISFHSLEDGMIKRAFKELAKDNFKILTKKPLCPIMEEISVNKRARSAKLRAIQCI